MNFLVLSVLIGLLPVSNIDQWRTLFMQAKDDAKIAQFYSAISSSAVQCTKERAYLGVATAMNASCQSWPGEKLDFFNRGKDILESCVAESPSDGEIRFLRFSIQCETPGILGYTSNIKDDISIVVQAIQNGITQECPTYWNNAIYYMLGRSEVDESQKQILRKYVN
ncbi:MAG: hypothetical protein SGI87_06520 [Flavobacteriales bacterium]|nr:hypothetical protein [Flavobacteriales bacterium]